jgi:hypothetical protein
MKQARSIVGNILPGKLLLVLALQSGMHNLATVEAASATVAPPFGDTAGTVFDIIRADDPSTFVCLEYIGRESRDIWDKRVEDEPVINTYVFDAQFSDGTGIRMAINPEFGSEAAARAEALRYVEPLGQLPTALRKGIRRFSVHRGNKGFHAGDEQIIVYAGTATDRLGYNHLEESIFHEAVHASWDAQHRLADGWLQAQQQDGRFLTRYGQASPEREDLAETALFAYAILHFPDRLPPADTDATVNAVPNRIAYIETLLPTDAPLTSAVSETQGCAANQ